MSNKIYTIADDAQLDYVLDTIERLDSEIAERQRRLAFDCENSADAYDALQCLREVIADFSVSFIAAAEESDR